MQALRNLAIKIANSSATVSILLTALNLSICWRLFKIEYTDHFSSIEGSFIAIARYISRHWGDFSWWPIWHCGMPYQDTYVPLLHLVAACVASAGNISAARAYHGVTGMTYALGAVTLYWMAVRLGASRGAAFLSAVLYSLFSPSLMLMPEMARDMGGLWYGRRLQVLTVYGEGPHITAMTLLPIAVAALESAVARRTYRAFALAALSIAVVFLTNIPGTMALGLAVFCWISAQPQGRRMAAWVIAASASILAYGLACYGVPPSSAAMIVGNVGAAQTGFANSLQHGPVLLAAVLALVAAAGHLLSRGRVPLLFRFAILYFGLTAVLVLSANAVTFELLPQVGRLHLEMEMGACLLLGGAGWALYTLIPRKARLAVAVLCIVPLVIQIRHYRWRARIDIHSVDLAKRSEYTTARWLDANLHGERVYVMGSTSFWLNAFTDTPQLVGCCAESQSMPVLRDVPYLINAGVSTRDTELSRAYLQALGVRALVANGADSTDEYKNIRVPERFAGLFPVLHREQGDTVYSVLPVGTSWAHVLRPGEEVPVRSSGLPESSNVVRYAGVVVDNSRPRADFRWLHNGQARIIASLRRDDLVSVQVAWFRGWKASVRNEAKAVTRDGLGFLIIRPECDGNCEIALEWTGPRDLKLAAAISATALIVIVVLLSRERRVRMYRQEKSIEGSF